MAKIQSNASVASTCATAIQSGASGITAVGKVTKDESSQYSGQTSADLYIDEGYLFYGGFQCSPVGGCITTSCKFWCSHRGR